DRVPGCPCSRRLRRAVCQRMASAQEHLTQRAAGHRWDVFRPTLAGASAELSVPRTSTADGGRLLRTRRHSDVARGTGRMKVIWLLVEDPSEVDDDLVRDVTEIVRPRPRDRDG